MPADVSIIPSMPMLTTPERSHQRPAMAPSAIGVPSRSDSTSSCITLVSRGCRQRQREDDHERDEQDRAAGSARRWPAARERRSKNVATATSTNTMPIAVTVVGRVDDELGRVGRRLEA